jgi:hypothetical protein
MTDERREAAEKWAKEQLPDLVRYQREQDAGNYGMASAWNADDVADHMADAHLAGQEYASKAEATNRAENALLREALRDVRIILMPVRTEYPSPVMEAFHRIDQSLKGQP